MGSYLKINNRETNCKTFSKILIDAIVNIDCQIMNNKNSTNKERKYFVPEYYEKINGKEVGYGNWIISKKGMALLVQYLKSMYEDDEITQLMGIEEHKYFLEHLVKEDEKEERIANFTENAKEEIQWCFYYVTDILVEMTIYGIKKVEAKWV